jgi:hypothetical protein
MTKKTEYDQKIKWYTENKNTQKLVHSTDWIGYSAALEIIETIAHEKLLDY